MFVDLTLPVEQGMYMPQAYWHPPVEITVLGTHEKEGRASRKLMLGTHTGTHIDAPLHFLKDAYSIDQMALDRLIGYAQTIDISFVGPKHAITGADLEKGLSEQLTSERVLINTGWLEKTWGTPDFPSNRPYFTLNAAEWLLEHGVRLVGMDLPDPDSPQDFVPGKPAPVHVFFFSHDIIVIENVANLSKLTSKHFKLIALPLNLRGCDASPARVIAEIEN